MVNSHAPQALRWKCRGERCLSKVTIEYKYKLRLIWRNLLDGAPIFEICLMGPLDGQKSQPSVMSLCWFL
jgi:hypothetical protein